MFRWLAEQQQQHLFIILRVQFTRLLGLAQEKDAQIRRTKQALKAAEEKAAIERADAAASPLDTAQRSVIRNLGLKVSTLSQQVAGMKEERDLAQVQSHHGKKLNSGMARLQSPMHKL